MPEPWLPTLMVPNPEAGFELAIKLSRMAVKLTQPAPALRDRLREIYEQDVQVLVSISSVVSINFHTVAAANNWWRDQDLKDGKKL